MPKNTLTITYTGKKKRIKSKSGKAPLKSGPCCFCLSYKDKEEEYGKLIKKNGFIVHYFCLLFSSALCQRGRTDKDGIYGFLSKDIDKELTRGARLKCDYCKNPGATIGCVITSCRRKFHFVCGKENGSLHQFYDTFRSFCPDHRPEQSYVYDNKSKKTATCPICMSSVPARCSVDTLKSNCCKNSWFHRSCIQRYGLSAGLHFFKCPMCNDVDKFQKEMLEFGIYIPDQDAAWEKEPNAFNELLERHNVCDAEQCKCPHGRNDSSSGKWEILLCSSCGSVGSHVGCNGLIFIKRLDEQLCIDCWDIHQRVESRKKSENKSEASKSPKSMKTLSLTEAQRDRQLRELKAVRGSDSLINIKNCDTDTDIDVVNHEDSGSQIVRKGTSVKEQNRMSKRQKLSVDGSRRSTGNASSDSLSANITLTDDSRGQKVTATISRSSSRSSSNSSVSVASSNVSNTGLPDLSQSFQSDSDSETESCDSSSFSINTVTDLPQRKALTISWRGRKVHITNPSTPEKHNWSLQLQMGNNSSQTQSSSRRSSTSSSSYTRSGQTFTRSSSSDDDCNEAYRASPQSLVPVDDEISVRIPTKSSEKFSWEDDTMSAPTRYGPVTKYTSVRNSIFSEDISSNPNQRAASSSDSIISISSSDSDTGDQLNPRKKRNRNYKPPAVGNTETPSNVVDLTENDVPSTIRLIPRYLVRPPIRPPVMEPEVVILD